MTLGEKLKLLLKENNMSQEDLAEQLYVSRQAVGKWVNDKGIPDVEKIVQISNIFNVSLDYLLKDNIEENNNQNKKHYVSKEILDKYLSYSQKRVTQVTFGIALILLSSAFDDLEYNNIIKNISYWLTFITGLIIIILYFFQTKQYQEIKNNEIVIEKNTFEDFKEQKEFRRKKYIIIVIVSIVTLLLSSEIHYLNRYLSTSFCNFLICILDAISIAIFIWSCMSMNIDSTIIKNTQKYTKSKKERYSWVYIALPVTIVAVIIGIFTNAWSPYAPIIILFCALLITICKILLESEGKNE